MFDVNKVPDHLWKYIYIIAGLVAISVVRGVTMFSYFGYFYDDSMYQLGSNVSYMHVENMNCRYEASVARNECLEKFITDKPARSKVAGADIVGCDTIGNALLEECEANINWDEFGRLQDGE